MQITTSSVLLAAALLSSTGVLAVSVSTDMLAQQQLPTLTLPVAPVTDATVSQPINANTQQTTPTGNGAINLSSLRINLQIFRHGFSCANVVEDCSNPDIQDVATYINGDTKNITTALTCAVTMLTGLTDPVLANYGKDHSTTIGQTISQDAQYKAPDLVLTSSLLRTMETAAFMFPSVKNIYQAPHLTELPTQVALLGLPQALFPEAPNFPQSIAYQKSTVASVNDATTAARFNFSLVSGPNDNVDACTIAMTGNSTLYPRCSGSLDRFLPWLANLLATNPPMELKEKLAASTTNEITIAVVAHGDLMKRDILKATPSVVTPALSSLGTKVRNNQGVYAVFGLNGGSNSYTLVRQTLWDSVPGAVQGIGPADCTTVRQSSQYQRCVTQNPAVMSTIIVPQCLNN